jgi:phosphatidate cytidylyltransferase
LSERALSAAVLVPAVIVVFVLGQPWLTLAVAALAVLAAIEVGQLLQGAGAPVDPGIAVFAAPIAVLGAGLAGGTPALVVAFVGAVVTAAAIAAFRRRDARVGFSSWMGSSFGALYIALLAALPAILVAAPAIPDGSLLHGLFDAGRTWLLVLLLSVWSFDTFAYLAGRTFPRGRFMSHISPNKTWSGVVGGTVAVMVVDVALCWAVGQDALTGLFLGVVVAVAAQAGDLAESMLKRAAGAKDSGTLIPGHGGVLDRIDSFLFAAPAFLAVLVLRDWPG